jgi:hypothetical protein
MILRRVGPPNKQHRFGVTLLHEIVTMGDHVTAEERAAFASAALDAEARMDLRDDLLKSTPPGWACRWGRELSSFATGRRPVEADAEPRATPPACGKEAAQTLASHVTSASAVERPDNVIELGSNVGRSMRLRPSERIFLYARPSSLF